MVAEDRGDPADDLAGGPADAVGQARRSWDRRGLGDGAEAFLAMSSVLRLQRLMTGSIEVELRARDLNLTDYMVLMTLELGAADGELISGVARSLVVHPTTATLATDRLAARGLVRREQHPQDRRAVRMVITDPGRELLRATTGALAGCDFGLAGTSPADRARLVELTARMRADAGDDR